MRLLLIFLHLALFLIFPNFAVASDVRCEGGAYVDKSDRCEFFYFFRRDTVPVDPRIAYRLHVGPDDPVRSIALVVGVDDYPNMPEAALLAAGNDVRHLTSFLSINQDFDEIIVLRNEDASEDNIHYFLSKYILSESLSYQGNTRILFAYSGHGTRGGDGIPPSLVLSDAKSESDVDHLLYLSALNSDLRDLSRVSYHLLALINSCYGGSVFSLGAVGGNADVSDYPGAYAVTAGPDDDLVWSLGGVDDGSIFFDNLILGVSSGDADSSNQRVRRSADGKPVQSGGITRLGALVTYLTTKIEELRDQDPVGGRRYEAPWIGSMQADATRARGGFFFMSPYHLEPGVQVAVAVPPGAISTLPGRPDLSVFNGDDEYPIKGIDISSHTEVKWETLDPSKVRFVYMKATQGGTYIDRSFVDNWNMAGKFGFKRGAYHFFDHCLDPEVQFKNLAAVVPVDSDALPIAIDFEWDWVRQGPSIVPKACSSDIPPQERLLTLLQRVEQHYGKLPILYYPKGFSKVAPLDDRFEKYPVWTADFSKGSRSKGVPTGVNSPWSIWQYTDREKFPGAESGVDANAFYGSEAQFAEFLEGKVNGARRAALVQP